jgi:hypothetical protein
LRLHPTWWIGGSKRTYDIWNIMEYPWISPLMDTYGIKNRSDSWFQVVSFFLESQRFHQATTKIGDHLAGLCWLRCWRHLATFNACRRWWNRQLLHVSLNLS